MSSTAKPAKQVDFQQATLHYLITDVEALPGVTGTGRMVMFTPSRLEIQMRVIGYTEPLDLQVRVYGPCVDTGSEVIGGHVYFDQVTYEDAPDWVHRLVETAKRRIGASWS